MIFVVPYLPFFERKVRLSQRLATVATYGHDSSIFLKSYDTSETNSGMIFVAILFHFRPQIGDTKNVDLLIHGITGKIFLNGRVMRRSNVNMKVLDVLFLRGDRSGKEDMDKRKMKERRAAGFGRGIKTYITT